MIKILELFGGIGACSKALEKLGIEYEIVDYVEIDKHAVNSFNAMHGTNFEPQDICEWNKDIEADLVMHGSPCQDFSLAGKQAGGDEGSGTRSSLMYETIRIVEKIKPKYVIWENVKNVVSKKHIHNFENYIHKMTELGYKSYYKILNSKCYGIPQNRERVFTISIRDDLDQSFEFPEPIELKLKLKDMLEDNVDEKYYLSDKMINYVCSRMPSGSHHITTGINMSNKDEEDKLAGTICTEPGNKPSDNYIIDNKDVIYSKEEGCLLIKNATKQGYLEATEGDGVDIGSRMQYHRGNVQKGMCQTITTKGGDERGVVCLGGYGKIGSTGQYHLQNRVYDDKIATSVTTSFNPYYKNGLRIRKLTPKECWRLMGFDDSDYEKAAEVNSNAQLYKQAGNSIVVNVLEAILKNLLKEEIK